MTSIKKDQNSVNTMFGVLNTDGVTITPIKANDTAHALKTSDGTSGSDHGTTNAKRDENRVPALMATSTDGVTPIALYVDSSGNLLTKST